MGKGPRYHVAFRRRKANLTNYKSRKAMILSGLPRLVVRFSLNYISAQLIEASANGDKVLASACSRELVKFGWQASSRNTPAAYLTGLLLGKRALILGFKEAILDIGLRRSSGGAKVFATLKGAVDASLQVPYNGEILPSDERISGEHIASYAKKMFDVDQQLYNKTFSKYLSKGLNPENLTNHFLSVKDNIFNSFKDG